MAMIEQMKAIREELSELKNIQFTLNELDLLKADVFIITVLTLLMRIIILILNYNNALKQLLQSIKEKRICSQILAVKEIIFSVVF